MRLAAAAEQAGWRAGGGAALLAVGVPLAITAALLPERTGLPLRFAVVLAGITAVAVGVWRNAPASRRPWLLVLGGLSASAAGDVVVLRAMAVGDFHGNLPLDAWLTAIGGVLLLAGLLDAIRFIRGIDLGGSLDALVVALAGGTALWQLLVVPAAVPGWSGSGTEVAGSLQVLILVTVLALLIRTTRSIEPDRRYAAHLLAAALVLGIAAYLTGALREASSGAAHYAGLRAGLGALANLLTGVAALHPTMRALTERHEPPEETLSARRTLGLGAALAAPPAIVLYTSVTSGDAALLTLAGSWVLLVPAVLVRLHLIARGRDAAQRRASVTEQRLASLVAHTGDLLLLVQVDDDRTDATIRYASPAATRILGCLPRELVGRQPWSVAIDQDQHALRSAVLDLDTFPRRADVQAVLPTGATRWLEAVIDSYVDAEEGPALVLTLGDITDRKRAELEWEEAARHDGLTDLLNRRGLQHGYASKAVIAASGDRRLAVVLCDLDGFKAVNDGYGHHVGDLVLREIAGRLQASVRADDLVGRLGGDEFVLICDLGDDDCLEAMVDRCVAALAPPVTIDGVRLQVGLSAGMAVAEAADVSFTELLQQADDALYRAKAAGKGQAVWAGEPLRRRSSDRLTAV